MEYSKEQLIWAFQFLSVAMRTRFLKLKRVVESENRLDHGRLEARILTGGANKNQLSTFNPGQVTTAQFGQTVLLLKLKII